jgi:hypothetical protein
MVLLNGAFDNCIIPTYVTNVNFDSICLASINRVEMYLHTSLAEVNTYAYMCSDIPVTDKSSMFLYICMCAEFYRQPECLCFNGLLSHWISIVRVTR